MKYWINLIISLLLASNSSVGQLDTLHSRMRVDFDNYAEDYLLMGYYDVGGRLVFDTLKKSAGSFFIFDGIILKPQIISLCASNYLIASINLAPGYALTITGDATDNQSLRKSLQVTGVGAESNKYERRLCSLLEFWNISFTPYEPDFDKALSELQRFKYLKDTLIFASFFKAQSTDLYLNYFGSMKLIDNYFDQLRLFINFAKNRKLSNAFIYKILNEKFQFNVELKLCDSFLVSETFKEFIVFDLPYILLPPDDSHMDTHVVKKRLLALKTIEERYKGKVKKFAIQASLEKWISNCELASELDVYENYLLEYLVSNNDEDISAVKGLIAEKKREISYSSPGSTVPDFTALDIYGKDVRVSDFPGKVIYMDLWASWCLPCRKQTPYLKKLSDRYKQNSEVVFMSIAVHDRMENWKKALKDDLAEGIQLYDVSGIVSRFFKGTLSIPRFMLIGKDGRIVDFDAPLPIEFDKITKLIDVQLLK